MTTCLAPRNVNSFLWAGSSFYPSCNRGLPPTGPELRIALAVVIGLMLSLGIVFIWQPLVARPRFRSQDKIADQLRGRGAFGKPVKVWPTECKLHRLVPPAGMNAPIDKRPLRHLCGSGHRLVASPCRPPLVCPGFSPVVGSMRSPGHAKAVAASYDVDQVDALDDSFGNVADKTDRIGDKLCDSAVP